MICSFLQIILLSWVHYFMWSSETLLNMLQTARARLFDAAWSSVPDGHGAVGFPTHSYAQTQPVLCAALLLSGDRMRLRLSQDHCSVNSVDMHDEQVKLKVDSPWSQFAKEPIIPALLSHAWAVNSQWNTIGLCLFLDQERPLFYQQSELPVLYSV